MSRPVQLKNDERMASKRGLVRRRGSATHLINEYRASQHLSLQSQDLGVDNLHDQRLTWWMSVMSDRGDAKAYPSHSTSFFT
jgi:hypothetical protein